MGKRLSLICACLDHQQHLVFHVKYGFLLWSENDSELNDEWLINRYNAYFLMFQASCTQAIISALSFLVYCRCIWEHCTYVDRFCFCENSLLYGWHVNSFVVTGVYFLMVSPFLQIEIWPYEHLWEFRTTTCELIMAMEHTVPAWNGQVVTLSKTPPQKRLE